MTQTRTGSQVPSMSFVPQASRRSAADDAITVAEITGLVLDPWQRLVLEGGLGELDGKWSAFEAALVVPRRNGKSALLQAIMLASLFVWREGTVIYSAHRFDTAQETFAELRALIEGCDELADEVAKIYTANGKEAIKLRNGCRVKFMSRAKGSGRGFSGDRIIFDEAYELPPQALGAMIPTMASRSMLPGQNPQIWYASSAAMSHSRLLHSLRRRARAESPGKLFYAEWAAADGADNGDVEAWYEANPALGIRIAEEFVRDELTALAHSPGEFRRERLGIPDPEPEVLSGDLPLPLDAWGLRSVSASSARELMSGRSVIGLGATASGSFAALGSASRLSDGRSFVQALQVAPGLAWIADELDARLEVLGRKVSAVAMPASGPLMSILPAIEQVCSARRVPFEQLTGKRWHGACAGFVRSTLDDELCHAGQVWLSTAIGGAPRRDLPSGQEWEWDLAGATADVSPLVAVTAALRVLSEQPSSDRKAVVHAF